VFGATLDDFHCSGVNRTVRLGDFPLAGFVAARTPTAAPVVARYDDGRPATTENRHGRGSAVILGWEGSGNCHRPGNTAAQDLLPQYALGAHRASYAGAEAIVYRLAASDADHFILLNDHPAPRSAKLSTPARIDRAAHDPVSGEKLVPGAAIEIQALSARWVRFEK